MTLPILIALVLGLLLCLAAAWHRRADLRRQQAMVAERAAMAARSNEQAPLQMPVIDLAKCLGCGTCVRECPEDGVLALVHGQAAVVNAAACVGHARCVSECPAGAVTLSRGDVSQRTDVPVLDEQLQAIDHPGLYLVGEITARSLIRTAAVQGAQVAATIAATRRSQAAGVHDVVIVGAGPGGLAAALGCRQHRLDFVWIDQEMQVGGTVAKYPRRKLVLTDEVTLPLHGRLPQREYGKEELVALWQQLAARHALPFRGGVTFDHCEPQPDGTFVVHTDQGSLRAGAVVLAVGRRGSPKRLGVPGEDLPHVTYSLLDAATYQNRQCVVVGGGDSAVETAVALAEQPGNQVTLVYRQDAFFRLRSKNRDRLQRLTDDARIEVLLRTNLVAIGPDAVELQQQDGAGGGSVALQLAATDVFIMAGGVPPFAQLERSGVSFDAKRQPARAPAAEPAGNGFLLALCVGAVLAALTLAFVLWHADYYLETRALRAADPKHALLRPDRALGLAFGFAATGAIVANLLYLVRRQQWLGLRFGQLTTWMHVHVATGVLAVLLAMLHAAMAPKTTIGGFAFWALVVLLVTGAIGRWFYAWLPRRANGRELELSALRAKLAVAETSEPFAVAARSEVLTLLDRRQWQTSWIGRALGLVGLQWDLWRTQRRLRRAAELAGADPAAVAAALADAREAHAAAVAVAHLEDLRALLGTWRWLHRWLALLMVLLLVAHVVVAVLHGAFTGGGR